MSYIYMLSYVWHASLVRWWLFKNGVLSVCLCSHLRNCGSSYALRETQLIDTVLWRPSLGVAPFLMPCLMGIHTALVPELQSWLFSWLVYVPAFVSALGFILLAVERRSCGCLVQENVPTYQCRLHSCLHYQLGTCSLICHLIITEPCCALHVLGILSNRANNETEKHVCSLVSILCVCWKFDIFRACVV
jgi:hypothetical protein